MSQFAFLQPEWPEVFDAAARAEAVVRADPRTACFYARRALEWDEDGNVPDRVEAEAGNKWLFNGNIAA